MAGSANICASVVRRLAAVGSGGVTSCPGPGKPAAGCGIEPTMLTGDSNRKLRRRARDSGATTMPPTTTAAPKPAAVTHSQDATEGRLAEEAAAPAGDPQAVANVGVRVGFGKRLQVIPSRDPLCELAQVI